MREYANYDGGCCGLFQNLSFAEKQWETLGQWCCYLQEQGMDPQNQLCTDDFAGHLAHNCNLSVKAIMGIASFAILCRMRGMEKDAAYWMGIARSMAKTWERTAANGDGTYRLAFDQPGTFSMKYNMLWDVLFGTGLFDKDMINSEFSSYVSRHLNRYGMPLDNRADYTKSDWILWCASVLEDPAFFKKWYIRYGFVTTNLLLVCRLPIGMTPKLRSGSAFRIVPYKAVCL